MFVIKISPKISKIWCKINNIEIINNCGETKKAIHKGYGTISLHFPLPFYAVFASYILPSSSLCLFFGFS